MPSVRTRGCDTACPRPRNRTPQASDCGQHDTRYRVNAHALHVSVRSILVMTLLAYAACGSLPSSFSRASPTIQIGQQVTSAMQRTLPYIVGPAIEFHVHGPLGLMAEALYTRAVYDYRWFTFISPSSGVESVDEKHAVSRWEFPILLKYQARARHLGRPFVTAGMSIQYSRNYNAGSLLAHQGILGGVLFVPWLRPSSRSTAAGPTVGVGWSSHVSRLRPSIEFATRAG